MIDGYANIVSIVKKHGLRLWAVMGVITFSILALAASAAVYHSWRSARAFAAIPSPNVTESPNWQPMAPAEKWTSVTDRTLIPVPAADYVKSQLSTYHVLKKEESSVSERLDMAAYFDAGMKNSTQANSVYIADPVFQRYNSGPKLGQYKLDISGHRIPGRNCQTYDPLNAYGPTDTFITVTLSYEVTAGPPPEPIVYKIPENNVCPYNASTADRPGNTNNSLDTKNNKFFARYPIPGFAFNNNLKMDPGTKLYKVNISIAYDANIPAGFTNLGIDSRQQLVFRVKIPNGGVCPPGSCRRFIGMLAAADNLATSGVEPNFSTLSRLLDDVSNIPGEVDRFYGAQKFEFGLPCTEGPAWKKVTVYDTDNNEAGKKLTGYYVESYDPATGTWSKLPVGPLSVKDPINGDILSAATAYNYDYDTDGDALTPRVPLQQTMPANSIVPSYGSGVVSTVSVMLQPNVRYRLVVDPVWSNNHVTVGLPTDSIYGMVNCPPATPTAECIPESIPPGLAYNTTVRIKPAVRVNNIAGPWPYAGVTLNLTVKDPDGFSTAYPGTAYDAANETALLWRLTAQGIDLPVTKAGKYQFNWSLGGAIGATTGLSCAADSYSGDQPYFKVYGGDILAGISLGGAPVGSADIISWNKDDDGGGGYVGAGSQLAAIASGNISHFISNSDLITGGPSSLAFANADTGPGLYGGDFGAAPMLSSYIDAAEAKAGTAITPILAGVFDVTGKLGGVYRYDGPGNVTVQGEVGAGQNITVIVKGGGSVYIGAETTYEPYNLTNIPQLNVYTTGNIVVDRNVTKMRGIFVAEGSSSKFYTCGTATGPIGYAELASDTSLVSQCKASALTVYGSVVAHEVILSRTFGSWVNNGPAAEEFRHGPETWLAKPFMGTDAGDTFDNYVSLPPIL